MTGDNTKLEHCHGGRREETVYNGDNGVLWMTAKVEGWVTRLSKLRVVVSGWRIAFQIESKNNGLLIIKGTGPFQHSYDEKRIN